MENIKLTQSQVDGIEDILKFADKEEALEHHIIHGWSGRNSILNMLGTAEMVQALFGGYETIDEQEEWFNARGREVWELREGDVLRQKESPRRVREVHKVFASGSVLMTPNHTYYYKEELERYYLVVSFVDERLDK